MQSKAPPIQWLPVFEAAARLLSFRKAAQELCVSPPAVSQQIRALEEYLGFPLFDRRERRLRLTDEGEFYARYASQIMELHQTGYRELAQHFSEPVLRVSAPLFAAQEILIPNYLSFRDVAPGIELRILTGSELVRFETDNVDAAIRFGSGNWPDYQVYRLCEVELCLVCSPGYAQKHDLDTATTITQSQLQELVLLTIRSDLGDWKTALPGLQPGQRIVCDSYFSSIKSAEEGLGIAFGIRPVINRLLHSGSLMALQSEPMLPGLGYWLVTPKETARQGYIDLLYHWVSRLFEKHSGIPFSPRSGG